MIRFEHFADGEKLPIILLEKVICDHCMIGALQAVLKSQLLHHSNIVFIQTILFTYGIFFCVIYKTIV